MCRSFEVISGKVNKGNVEYLKGICKAAVDAGKDVTILDIPVICSYLEKKILMTEIVVHILIQRIRDLNAIIILEVSA